MKTRRNIECEEQRTAAFTPPQCPKVERNRKDQSGSQFVNRGGVNAAVRRSLRIAAFTLIEIMIAIFIFMLILSAVYSIWHGIIRGTKAGIKAVQEVQRSRMAMHCLEQALLSARVFQDNIKYYWFISDSAGSRASVSMTCRLPSDFLGMGFVDPNLRMRRVEFFTRSSSEGGDELVMSHSPILLDTNAPACEPYSIVLAKDVSRFEMEFLEPRKNEWVTDWADTNRLPVLVRVTLGLGKLSGNSSVPQDLASRIIHLPAQNIVTAPVRPGLQGMPNQPGVYPPGGGPPGGFPPGGFPPGGGLPPGGGFPPPGGFGQ